VAGCRDFDKGAGWSIYDVQRLYLDFLDALEIGEDSVPGDSSRAELVCYQLDKFGQATPDFEQIYFFSSPYEKDTTSPTSDKPQTSSSRTKITVETYAAVTW